MTDHATAHDLEAIRSLKYRYAEAVDRHVSAPSEAGVAAIVEFFTPDGRADLAQFGTYEGPAVANFFRDVLPGISAWTRHYMLNPILEVEGTHARGRWSAMAHVVFKGQSGVQVLYVRYEDVYAKTAGGWRMASTVAHFDTPPT